MGYLFFDLKFNFVLEKKTKRPVLIIIDKIVSKSVCHFPIDLLHEC